MSQLREHEADVVLACGVILRAIEEGCVVRVKVAGEWFTAYDVCTQTIDDSLVCLARVKALAKAPDLWYRFSEYKIAEPKTEFDYTVQCWVVDGKYAACGHSKPDCGCYGKLHAGEPANRQNSIH